MIEEILLCDSCKNREELPYCVIYKQPNVKNITEVLDGMYTKTDEVYVCPVDAHVLEGDVIKIDENCIECNICLDRCLNVKQSVIKSLFSHDLDDIIFSGKDLSQVAGLLNLYFDGTISFFSEVQAEGHSRTKRIDIVAKKENMVFLIKLSKAKNKTSYYMESYNEVIAEISTTGYEYRVLNIFPNDVQSGIEKYKKDNTYLAPIGMLEDVITTAGKEGE